MQGVKEYRFQQKNSDWQRVIVVGDVLALPYEFWCMGGFGTSISVDWLMHEPRFLPGRSKSFRLELAAMLERALELAHADDQAVVSRAGAAL